MRSPVGKRTAIIRAKELLDKHRLGRSGRVDVNKIAKVLGITVVAHDMDDDDSGILLVKDGRAVIIVNGRHHENRRRFSLAHELAHFLLHARGSLEIFHRDQRSSLGTSRIEVEANAFAAELLMPEEDIKAWVQSVEFDLLDENAEAIIVEKAKKLGVSPQALSIRIERLGLLRFDYFG